MPPRFVHSLYKPNLLLMARSRSVGEKTKKKTARIIGNMIWGRETALMNSLTASMESSRTGNPSVLAYAPEMDNHEDHNNKGQTDAMQHVKAQ